MDSIEVELKVLIECLKKKEQALSQIASITENQGFVLGSGLTHDEVYSFFMQMNVEKQDSIQRVLQCDQVFENVFAKVGPVLDENPDMFGEQVRVMQGLIRSVMDIDVQIRLAENENTEILNKALTDVQASLNKPDAISGGEYGNSKMLDAYKSQSRHRNG